MPEGNLVTSEGTEYYAHEVVVQAAPGTTRAQLDSILSDIGGRVLDDESPIAARLGFFRIGLASAVTADEAITQLIDTELVASASRNYIIKASVVPNDPGYRYLWGLDRIRAPDAWEFATGSNTVVVGVSDSGIDLDHPDLAPNLWTNPGEIAGNGVDDDGNGYIDDVHGYDFIGRDPDPDDDNGHGTHCAGTIGAVGNNSAGVAGVNWNVRLVALKLLNAQGSGDWYAAANALVYAADMGIPIVNASWGCLGCSTSFMHASIEYLGAAGGLLVAAAGNDTNNNDVTSHAPSNAPQDNVIAVAATDRNDGLASFSNWGLNTVDVAAPGVGIVSTYPGGQYSEMSGTSMAAPHVAGVAALYLSRHPDTSPSELRTRIMDTADPTSSVASRIASGARINAYALLTQDDEPPPAPTNLVAAAGNQSDVRLSWGASEADDLASYRIAWGTASGSYVRTLDVAGTTTEATVTDLSHGVPHYFVVSAVDTFGNTSPPSNEALAVVGDETPPPSVLDLSAENLPGLVAPGYVSAASGEYSEYYQAAHAYDGSPDTAWSSPARHAPQEELLEIDLGAATRVERVDLLASVVYPEFFPADFDIELSTDGVRWQAVAGARQSPPPEGWLTLSFPAQEARFVRLRILEGYAHPSGLYYSSIAELRVREEAQSPDAILIHFTAPGDNPGEGTAARYDVRVSERPITEENFETRTPVAAPTPVSSGTQITHLISGLRSETTYYVALKAHDLAGNASAISNVAVATTLAVPPGAVTDLRATDIEDDAVTLRWTAPGADGYSGQAAEYELRYAANPITPANFDAADRWTNIGAPRSAGSQELLRLAPLPQETQLYFALRTLDAQGHHSSISNIASARTGSGPDLTAPARVTDLAAYLSLADQKSHVVLHALSSERGAGPGRNLLDGDRDAYWQSQDGAEYEAEEVVLDLQSIIPVTRVRLHASSIGHRRSEFPAGLDIEGSVDGVGYATLTEVRNMRPADGTWNSFRIEPTHIRYLRLRITERGDGACAPDAPECLRAVSLGEVEVHQLTEGLEADLSFVAPGDDGYLGAAHRYLLYHADSPVTTGNLTSADLWPLSLPLPGGMLEVQQVGPLALEARHCFALRAEDEAGNLGLLSNSPCITTPGVAPAPVTDLRAADVTADSAAILWTATGDDGYEGQATAYDLRLHTHRISEQNWHEATPLSGLSAPGSSGQAESFTATGLAADTEYYLALRVTDELGQASLLSNVLSIRTLDGTAPGPVDTLTAELVDRTESQSLVTQVAQTTGALSFETSGRNLTDGDPASAWMSPARASNTEEQIEFAFDAPTTLSAFRLRSALGYTDLFPKDFQLDVQTAEDGPWETVVSASDFSSPGGWSEWPLGGVTAHRARLVISGTRKWQDTHYAAIGEAEFRAATAEQKSVRLSWLAPGDDDQEGTATRYELRRGLSALTASNFDAADELAGPPTPRSAGSLERYTATGLAPNTTYCFGLRSHDETDNASEVSNSPCVTTPHIPPTAVSDLAVTDATASTLRLAWTAPGGEGSIGLAEAYDLRMSDRPISEENFADATPIPGVPPPRTAGSAETFSVTGLLGQNTYYFALKARNIYGQSSDLSNNAHGTTLDNVAPAAVTDLRATTEGSLSGAIILQFTAPTDGETGGLASYDLRYSTSPISADTFAGLPSYPLPAPRSPGLSEGHVLVGLSAETTYYFGLRTSDPTGNWSELSNEASAQTREEAPAAVRDLAVVSDAGGVTLSWTAPGDDGHAGTASQYDVRYSTTYISDTNFYASTAASGAPTPAAAGSSEAMRIDGLSPGTTYYFALRSQDERGNISPISNWASTETEDTVAPGRVSDLSATASSLPGRLNLVWTAPGDDGTEGLVQSYEVRYAEAPITSANFDQATLAATQPTPLLAGTRQSHTLTGLPDESLIYVALRARDDAGQWSSVSNTAGARTADERPATISDLTQVSATADEIVVRFTAPGDDGSDGTATSYEMRIASTAFTEATFGDAQLVSTGAPSVAGRTEYVTISALAPNQTYHLAVRAQDDRGNLGALSPVLQVQTVDTSAPGLISDLVASTASQDGAINLSWTAPGDDDREGQAARYELRYALSAINAQTWAAATSYASVRPPRTAGSAEFLRVGGLANETTYHFALRAIDEAGNEGPLSVSTTADTRPVPPSNIRDLRAEAGDRQVILRWTAPGDDGGSGTASAYEVRYRTGLMASTDFDGGIEVTAAAPSVAGSSEQLVVDGLQEATQYSFAIRAHDDVGATSQPSNIVTVTTLDYTPPAAPSAFTVNAPSAQTTYAAIDDISATSDLGPQWQAANLVDGDGDTAWASQAIDEDETETLTIDLGKTVAIRGLSLRPDSRYPHLFPRGFVLEAGTTQSTFGKLAEEEDFATKTADWLSWGFESRSVRYLRVRITDAAKSYGRAYAIIADLRVTAAAAPTGEARLTWLAPGDNEDEGQAANYEVYRSEQAFDEASLGSATLLSGPPTPGPAGTLQTMLVDGLSGEATYFWAIRAEDAAGNMGPLSAVVEATTNAVPPDPVQNLVAEAQGQNSILLRWTATGDDGSEGQASRYDIRMSTDPLTSQNFPLATSVAYGAPQSAGGTESVTVSGLAPGVRYRFGIVAYDEADTPSALSSIATAETDPAADTTAPNQVTDLSAQHPQRAPRLRNVEAESWSGETLPSFGAAQATDRDYSTAWSTSTADPNEKAFLRAELDALTRVDQIRVWPAAGLERLFPSDFSIRVSPNGLQWLTVAAHENFTAQPGEPVTAVFSAQEIRYVAVEVDALSSYGNGLYYAVVAELDVYEAGAAPGSAVVSWTAPGDDGPSGTAAQYELKQSGCPFSEATAAPIATPAPAVAGTPERVFLTGLSPGQYCLQLVSQDEAGNRSPASNEARIEIAPPDESEDTIGPFPISDLTASWTDATTVELRWTATGDDGTNGQARAYEIRMQAGPMTSEEEFAAGQLVPNAPAPAPSGTQESLTVTGLTPDAPYSFAIRTHDDAGYSSLSNVADAKPMGELNWVTHAGNHDFGGSSVHGVRDVAVGADGSVYVLGYFWERIRIGIGRSNPIDLTGAGRWDIYVAKLSASGDPIWAQAAGGSADDEGLSISVAPDGSVYVSGSYAQSAIFDPGGPAETRLQDIDAAMFLAKYSTSGALDWVQHAPGGGYAEARAIRATTDGGVVAAGMFYGTATFNPGEATAQSLVADGYSDLYTAQFSATGRLEWLRHSGGIESGVLRSIDVAPDDSVVLTGAYSGSLLVHRGRGDETTLTAEDHTDTFVVKMASDGSLEWARSAGGTAADESFAVTILSTGDVVVTGYFAQDMRITDQSPEVIEFADNQISWDLFVIAYDATGRVRWARRDGDAWTDNGINPATTVGWGMSHGPDDSIIVVGHFGGNATFGRDTLREARVHAASSHINNMFVAKYDSAGHFLWVKQAGGITSYASGTSAKAVAVGPDGRIVAAGQFSAGYVPETVFGRGEANETSLVADGEFAVWVAQFEP